MGSTYIFHQQKFPQIIVHTFNGSSVRVTPLYQRIHAVHYWKLFTENSRSTANAYSRSTPTSARFKQIRYYNNVIYSKRYIQIPWAGIWSKLAATQSSHLNTGREQYQKHTISQTNPTLSCASMPFGCITQLVLPRFNALICMWLSCTIISTCMQCHLCSALFCIKKKKHKNKYFNK